MLSSSASQLKTTPTTLIQQTSITENVGTNISHEIDTLISVSTLLSTTTAPPLIPQNKAAAAYYITLSITRPTTTYTSLVLLGDSYPLTTPTDLSDLSDPSNPSLTIPKTIAQHPGIPTSSIVGIVVGVVLVFLSLAGVFYVYILRARQYKRRMRRKSLSSGSRSRRSRRSSAAGPGPPPPPPPADGADGPFPPAGDP
ncbi:hypothetical protein BGZ60DRAFT_528485 [Tricladium varicosporioides]|nr:hypothetical protein BGZ60DRAFT_528485 [Hymenoscyphus varicosporioides]